MFQRATGLLLCSLALVLPALVIPGAATADVTVIGDDQDDAFVGSGSLLLPSGMYQDGRQEAAECPGCSWRAVVQCEMSSAGACRGPARLCGADAKWLRIYLRRPGGDEIDLGAACFGSGGPASRESAEEAMREVVREGVPELRPTMQPPGGVLPHLPVVFAAHQPDGAQTSHHTILDLPVDLTVVPRWFWDFGDGRSVESAQAGGRWPDTSVSHIYPRAGNMRVQVAAVWRATYVVDGLGPLLVEDPVTQEAALTVPVGEGRAVLVR